MFLNSCRVLASQAASHVCFLDSPHERLTVQEILLLHLVAMSAFAT